MVETFQSCWLWKLQWFVSYHLIPLIGTFFAPFGLKVYFPWETFDEGIWYKFKISSFGILCSSIIEEMRLWNVSSSLSKNCLLGSILPFVPFLLDYSTDFNTPLVITSFTFTKNSSSKRFGLPFLLCTVELSFCFFFVFFSSFLPVIYWCSYKGTLGYFFRNFSNADFVHQPHS